MKEEGVSLEVARRRWTWRATQKNKEPMQPSPTLLPKGSVLKHKSLLAAPLPTGATLPQGKSSHCQNLKHCDNTIITVLPTPSRFTV